MVYTHLLRPRILNKVTLSLFLSLFLFFILSVFLRYFATYKKTQNEADSPNPNGFHYEETGPDADVRPTNLVCLSVCLHI